MEKPHDHVGDLVVRISARRQQLDQAYYEDLCELRQQHGDRAVDQALSMWQAQRDAVAIAPRKQERGPQHSGISRANSAPHFNNAVD